MDVLFQTSNLKISTTQYRAIRAVELDFDTPGELLLTMHGF